MTHTLFLKGLRTIEAGLQGTFQEKFIDFLWKTVKDVPDEAWTECCTRLALILRKTDDLVAGDFMETLREISHEKARRASIWNSPPKPKGIPDWKGMAEKVCADPSASEASKGIARNLASRKDSPPRMSGGEKYRL